MSSPDASLRSPVESPRRRLVALGLLLGMLALVVALSLRGHTYRAIGDGNFYLHFMDVVAHSGPGAFPALFDEWLADPQAWISPSPLRVGFIAACAAWAQLFGVSVASLGAFSCASYCACVILNYVFAQRRFGTTFAFLLGTLLVFSPLCLGLSRLVLADNFTMLCLSLVVWSFIELLHTPASRAWWTTFALSFTFVILVKEVTILLVVPLALSVIFERFQRRTPLSLPRFAAALILPPLLALLLMALCAGSPTKIVEMARIVLTSPTTNEYAIKFCSGPWYRYLIDGLLFSPFVTVLAAFGLGGVLLRLRAGIHDRALTAWTIVTVTLLLEHSFLVKNARYLAILEVPLRMLALWFLFQLLPRSPRATLLIAAIVAILCILDWSSFQRLWVEGNLYDPTTPRLIGLRDIFPRKW